MPAVAAKPSAMKNLTLTIGASTYEQHVSNCQWAPSSTTVQWAGGTPDAVFTDTTSPTWAVTMNVIQDYETTGSLANYLLDNVGQQVEITFKPSATGKFGIKATVTIAPPAIGGAVNQFNESAVTMGSTKPVRIPLV